MTDNRQRAIDRAIDAWNSARDAYEAALSDDGDVTSLREALHDADRELETATGALRDRLATAQSDLDPLLKSLGAALQARVVALEHRSLEAERNAKHGELAGAGYDEREAIERLESAGAALGEVAASLQEALDALAS